MFISYFCTIKLLFVISNLNLNLFQLTCKKGNSS